MREIPPRGAMIRPRWALVLDKELWLAL